MKKFIKFIMKLSDEFNKNELYYIGNELTYKIVLAIFPLIIFLINILAFFNIKYDVFLSQSTGTIPDQVILIIHNFIENIQVSTDRESISNALSLSLLVMIGSSASGFYAIIRGINKSYGIVEKRNIVIKWIFAVVLVLQFVFMIVASSIMLVFGDAILKFINDTGILPFAPSKLISFMSYLFMIFIMLLDVMIIYKVSAEKKIKLISTLPGALVTVIIWIISSKGFNIYVNNFSNYNAVYGGIGSMFIFIFWINIISVVLLLGSQINALLEFDR